MTPTPTDSKAFLQAAVYPPRACVGTRPRIRGELASLSERSMLKAAALTAACGDGPSHFIRSLAECGPPALVELRRLGYAEYLRAFQPLGLTVTVRNRIGDPSPASDSRRPHP